MAALHPEIEHHLDTLYHSVVEGKVPERVLESQKEIDRLIGIAQYEGVIEPNLQKQNKKVLQLCAGYGASSLALLNTGFLAENIENVDAEEGPKVQHAKNAALAPMKFHVDMINHFLETRDEQTFHPDYMIGTWTSWTVIVDVLEHKLKHPKDTSVGLFTLCQLNPGIDDSARVEDLENLQKWVQEHSEELKEQRLICDLDTIESNRIANTYSVLIYRKPGDRRS